MSYCDGESKAIVNYTKPNNERVSFTTKKTPINIEIISSQVGVYRFYGIGGDGAFYQFTANGFNPGYAPNPPDGWWNGKGQTPTMDGNFIQPSWYFYVSGYGVETITEAVPGCKIKITGSGNNFTDDILCPDGSYTISCGDGCPPNHIKCKCNSYPGYCCIPCSEIRGGIAAATAAVRGINRG